jgi:hypothetical protein
MASKAAGVLNIFLLYKPLPLLLNALWAKPREDQGGESRENQQENLRWSVLHPMTSHFNL